MKISSPLSKQQLQEGDLIPNGDYDFEVADAQDKHSKKGQEMIELQLRIWLPDGRIKVIFDYLLESMPWKLGHFAQATGLMEQYESGELCSQDCRGRAGRLSIYIQRDKTGLYGDRSSVKDYLTDQEPTKPTKQTESFDDSIPF